MNKDLLNQLPADEQPVASELTSVAEDMQLSPAFQWELETQLMETAKRKSKPAGKWYTKIMAPVGWAVLAICAVFLINWTIRSLLINPPVAPEVAPSLEPSFETDIRQGRICADPLALAHDFSVFLTNQEKTGFIELDVAEPVDELRTFAWSPDGSQLAIVANKMGHGQIYIKDIGGQLEYVLPTPDLGYLMSVVWSYDGEQILTWSVQSNQDVYLMNADGTGSVEQKDMRAQLRTTPQFAPDNKNLIFYGIDFSGNMEYGPSMGLIQMFLNYGSVPYYTRVIGGGLEAEGSFAWSPDGSRFAYLEMMENELRLMVKGGFDKPESSSLASLPLPEGASFSMPASTSLSWSPDGKSLVFEFGEGKDHAIYLARADGSGLVKLADSAYAPTISADGRCLAYISNDQVFLMDLTGAALTLPVRVADLPAGRQTTTRPDKLQWRP